MITSTMHMVPIISPSYSVPNTSSSNTDELLALHIMRRYKNEKNHIHSMKINQNERKRKRDRVFFKIVFLSLIFQRMVV